jgi:hypothetical protein
MQPEMRYIEDEILPMLRETAAQTERAARQQLGVWSGEAKKPALLLRCPSPLAACLPDYNTQETHFDREKMLVSQLKGALMARAGGAAAVPSVRSNMGCGIYATLFGIKQELFPDKMPWIQQRLSKEALRRMTPDDLAIGPEFREGLEQMAYMKEMLEGTGVEVYPLDLQGVVDVAHLVLGDQYFYELYDDPEFVAHLHSLAVEALRLGYAKVMEIIDPRGGYVAHYNDAALPADKPVKLSEDTTTLLSPRHVGAFMPYTERVLDFTGGGYVHYCGKNDALYRAAMDNPRVLGVNFGNPGMHDMDAVLRDHAIRGKTYYGLCARHEGETRLGFFRRLVAAQDCGGAHLLLPYQCAAGERESVLADWDAAGGEVI